MNLNLISWLTKVSKLTYPHHTQPVEMDYSTPISTLTLVKMLICNVLKTKMSQQHSLKYLKSLSWKSYVFQSVESGTNLSFSKLHPHHLTYPYTLSGAPLHVLFLKISDRPTYTNRSPKHFNLNCYFKINILSGRGVQVPLPHSHETCRNGFKCSHSAVLRCWFIMH